MGSITTRPPLLSFSLLYCFLLSQHSTTHFSPHLPSITPPTHTLFPPPLPSTTPLSTPSLSHTPPLSPQLVSLTLDGVTAALQDRLKDHHSIRAMQMMFAVNFYALIYLTIGWYLLSCIHVLPSTLPPFHTLFTSSLLHFLPSTPSTLSPFHTLFTSSLLHPLHFLLHPLHFLLHPLHFLLHPLHFLPSTPPPSLPATLSCSHVLYRGGVPSCFLHSEASRGVLGPLSIWLC